MEISLNNIEYATPTPVTGLWFAIQKLKTEANKRILLETKIKIIVDTFKNPAITQEMIFEYLPLQDVSREYEKIENCLNDIVIARTAELPKE